MKRYSVFAIAREALRFHQGWERAWRSPVPKKSYDVVIVGAGGHGLATARVLLLSETAGAFGGLAIGLNGLTTALIVPQLARLFAAL